MKNLDIAVLDPTAQLANCLAGLITNLGVRFGWAASLPALLALLGETVPKLLLLSDGVKAEDTQLLRKRFPRAKLAMVYGVAPAAEFTTAAAAILAAIRLDALRWKFAHARKLLKHFVCEHVLAPRRGLVIDDYRLDRLIGRGGFGEVWLASSLTTGKAVAVKVVTEFARVRQERQSLNKYENLVKESDCLMPVRHSHYVGTRLFIVMPLAEMVNIGGKRKPASLETLLEQRREPFGPEEALAIIKSVLRGLATLHAAGLLHGDPSLSNVLKLNGRYVLGDPGLVRFIDDPGQWTNDDFYPRPRSGKPSDDLYAVGVILFALIAGDAPSKLKALTLDTYERSQLPVFHIIAKACNRNSEARYQSATDMLADLDAALAQASASSNRADSRPPAA